MPQIFNACSMNETLRGQCIIIVLHIVFIDQEDGKVALFVGSENKIFKAIDYFHDLLEMPNGAHRIIEFFRGHKHFRAMIPPVMRLPIVTLVLHV